MRVNVLFACGAVVALGLLFGSAALAEPPPRVPQGGENRWVPSLAITSGAVIQTQEGFADSVLFEGMLAGPPNEVPLQGTFTGDDLNVGPFVGGSLEVMSPALPVPTRPRFFVSGEILPAFASERSVAIDGDPGCVRGPEADAPCATDEMGERVFGYSETVANGQGTKVGAEIQTLVYGASMGVAWPFSLGERQLRIKPSAAWLSYEVEATGVVVNAACLPLSSTNTRCTTTAFGQLGFLRQPEALSASETKRFHGIGPGLDLEVDTGRFGPIGTSLFLGARFYRVLGNRNISFGTAVTYPSPVPNFGTPPPALVPDPVCSTPPRSCPDTGAADFNVEVDPWIYRAHVGIRFQWLAGFRRPGSQN